jgi:hypothetical protein
VRCNRPLPAEGDRLLRLATEHQAAYMICDSIAFACDGPPEAAESAQRYFQTVRRIGLGSLHLAHVNKSDQGDQKPFGSAFWYNGARSIWNVKRSSEATQSASEITLGLYHRKTNVKGLLPSVGLRVCFTPERTSIERVDVASVGDLAAGLPLWQRIERALTAPKTLHELSEELDASQDSIRKAVQRSTRFTRITDPKDHIHKIALVERRPA